VTRIGNANKGPFRVRKNKDNAGQLGVITGSKAQRQDSKSRFRAAAGAYLFQVAGWRWLCCALACCLALGAQLAAAQQGSNEGFVNREYPLKALFLYNFGGYVEWPAAAFSSAQDPFVIGVLGSAPLDEALREIATTKKIAGHNIVVERYASIDSMKACHILFIARDVPSQQQLAVVEKLRHHHVLIVGESKGFADRGGSVNFFVESNKIRFEINLEAAKEQQLHISSKLLSLAKIVQQGR